MSKSISIFGSCVSRDLFPANTEKYQIQKYVSFSSPMSMYQQAGSRQITMEELSDFPKTAAFSQRCLMLDHNKTGFAFLAEKISDYLIIDLVDIRFRIIEYAGGNTATYANSILLNKELFSKRFGEFTLTSPLDYSEEEWNACIDWFCGQVTKLYGANNIILHEFYMVEDYRNRENLIQKFPPKYEMDAKNPLIRKMYERFRNNIPGCHSIRMPEHVLADVFQKWGLYPLHFHELYYQYAYEALQMITDGGPDEEARLEALRQTYSDRFLNLRNELTINGMQKEKTALENNVRKLMDYSNYFAEILAHYPESLETVRSFCQSNHIQRIAVWGDLLPAKGLIPMFEQCGVKLDYVIGVCNHHKDAVQYKSGLPEYPPTDAIIICDTMAAERVKPKLQAKVDFPVYSAYDVLPMQKSK